MRVHVPHVLPTVGIDDLLTIDLQLFVGVDGNQHNPCRKKEILSYNRQPYDEDLCGNIKNFLNKFNYCHFFTLSHHNLKTAWLVTHHSTCRCGSTPGSELWDYEGPQVHAGSWERWGHFLPPGCPGYVGKEEACLLHPLHTPEANQTYIRNNQCIRFSETFSILKTMFCP